MRCQRSAVCNATSFLAAQGALDDGSVVRRVGVGANDGRYALILQLLSTDGGEVVDSRVMRWADSADGGYIELQEVGRSADSLTMAPAGSDPNGWADGDEFPCPVLTRPQWVCTKVDAVAHAFGLVPPLLYADWFGAVTACGTTARTRHWHAFETMGGGTS